MTKIIFIARKIPSMVQEMQIGYTDKKLAKLWVESKKEHLTLETLDKNPSEDELVLIDDSQFSLDFLNYQSVNYQRRLFLVYGLPRNVFSKNVIGFFQNQYELKANLSNFLDIISKQTIKVKNIEIKQSELLYVEIANRILYVYTVDRVYSLGYKSLSYFLNLEGVDLFQINRYQAVNPIYAIFDKATQSVKIANKTFKLSNSRVKKIISR